MSARASGWQQAPQSSASAAAADAVSAMEASCEPAYQIGSTAALPGGSLLITRIRRLCSAAFQRVWASIETRRAAQKSRSLRVIETIAMGEKRFVAIVQVQEERFLIGGGAAGLSLLARLEAGQEFSAILHEQGDEQKVSPRSLAANRVREAW